MLNTNVGKQGATMNKAPKKERNRGMYERNRPHWNEQHW